MPAYSKWRVRFVSVTAPLGGGNRYANIYALNLYDSNYKKLTPVTGGVAISSGEFAGYPPANAFDNSNSTLWSGNMNSFYPGPGSAYLGYEFPAPVEVAALSWWHDGAFNATDYRVEGWDGSAWVEVYALTNSSTRMGGVVGLGSPPEVDIGAKLYWRVLILRSQATQQPSCSELAMALSVGGANECVGGTPIAKDRLSSSYEAVNAFDGNNSTFWVSGSLDANMPSWIGYQFASAKAIKSVRFRYRSDGFGVNEAPQALAIQGSDDGITWTTAWADYNEPAWSGGETRTYSQADAPVAPSRRRQAVVC